MIRRSTLAVTLVLLTALLVVAPPASPAPPDTVVRPHTQDQRVSMDRAAVVALDAAADHVAVHWRGHPGADVTVAFSHDGARFGTPVPAGRDEIGEGRGDGTTYGALRSAGGAVAVRVRSDQRLGHVSVFSVADGAAAGRVTSQVVGAPAMAAAAAATTEPTVVSRQGWGADPALMTWAPQFYATRKLVVHHTDTSNDYADQAGAEAQIRAIYAYHAVTQDWGDIGYNFLIDRFGTVYEGRYSRDYAGANPTGDDAAGNGVTGAHASGWNSGTVGVALLGTLTTQDATPAAREALTRLLAWEASRNGIDPEATEPFTNPVSGATINTPNIAGHRNYVATACPGDTFYPTLPQLRRDVAAAVAGGTVTPDTSAPTAPTGLTAQPARTSVTLSWKAATDDRGVAGYEVWRRRGAGTWARVAQPTSLSHVDGSLARRTAYSYRVRARDAAGNLGAYSATVSTRTL